MESIVSSLLRFSESQPEALAFVEAKSRITYGALRGQVEAAAAWLHEAGVRPGETVALFLDWPEKSLSLFYGLAYLGAVILPIHPTTAMESQIALAGRFKARHMIVPRTLRPVANMKRIDLPDFVGSEFEPPGAVPPRGDEPDRPLLYHFTSGTTGTTKAVLFTHRQFFAWSLARSNPYCTTPRDRQVPPRPWPTKVALRDLFRIHVFGGALVNAPFPETGQALATLINDFGVTQLTGSPWQLRRLMQSKDLANLRLPPLRVLSLAGAMIFPEEVRAARETITPNVYVDYGSNEIGMIACLRPEDPADMPGKVGRLIPGVEGQAVDDDDAPLPAGEIGTLRFRASGMVQGYAGNEEATARHFRGGWFYPGDIGLIDAEGCVTLKGRVDDIINYGGVKVVPADIEPALKRHPDIVDVALVGVPDPMAGQRAVAFVVARRGLPKKELHDFWAMWVNPSELPRDVIFVAELPRNPEGKVLRDRLRESYLAGLPDPAGPETEPAR
jgi:acyl-coenzyme A synthetase/AMP-(fatty) acid ligase